MSDLKPITALGGEVPLSVTYGALSLSENTNLGLASLALRKGAVQPTPLGLVLPDPGRCSAGQGIAAFWTGPDQWMVEFPGCGTQDVAAELKALCRGCSVTEQTDGWAAFEISAPDGATVNAFLERLINVNLGEFGASRATRTAIEHMGVYVIRRAENAVAIMGMRSSAGSLWHALTKVAQRMTKETMS